jgi:uncharacterized damage-inducible protein DinB
MNFDLARSLEILERTPVVLADLLAGIGEDWTGSNEGPETWSPFDVVGHLIDAEETDWMERTRIIVGEAQERRFKPFDRFRHRDANKGRTLAELLELFSTLRRRNVADLKDLDLKPADLARTGEHPEFGTVTLAQLLATWVVHDLNHIGQIARVMAKQYKAAVGPWVAYLPILTR